jgi:DNA alkylation repair enzyme
MPNDNAARSTSKPDRSPEHTAGRYVERLQGHRSPADAAKRQRYLKSRAGDGDVVIGVRMKHVFELSKEFKEMPLGEIEELLESRIHEVRAGGVKIMAYQAASTTTPEGRRRELFELYLRRHDRINEGVRDAWSSGDAVQPAAQAYQRTSGPEEIADPVQQPAPAAQRPGVGQMTDRLLHQGP